MMIFVIAIFIGINIKIITTIFKDFHFSKLLMFVLLSFIYVFMENVAL